MFEKCQTQKFSLAEARGGTNKKRRPGSMSDYKRQLLEKQKMRYTYGVSEKQLVRYVKESVAKGGNPMDLLLKRLESRLDNVVYRIGLAKTRRFARQMTSHGHIVINGKKTTVPSYQVKKGDVITIREGSKESGLFTTLAEDFAPQALPAWLTFDLKSMTATVTGDPTVQLSETLFDPEQVLEYYSR